MATDTQVIYDEGTVVVQNATRWPAYTTKEQLLRDLFAAIGSEDTAVMDIIMRLSNSDLDSALTTDKASRAA